MDTARLKPCRCVSRGETVQRGDQFPFTARVTRREHSGFEQCMGHIAPSAPGNTDLSQKLRAALVDRHLAIRFRTCTGDRGKESSCTSASDCDLLLRHQTNLHHDTGRFRSALPLHRREPERRAGWASSESCSMPPDSDSKSEEVMATSIVPRPK